MQVNFKLNEKYMKKINGRSVTASKGSCLLCLMFGNPLENLAKNTSWRVQKPTFQQVSKILKTFGNLLKILETTVIKSLKQPLSIFEYFRNLRKLPVLSLWKKSENVTKCSK